MTNSRKRFVLIDPSFDGKSGDKWQYALAFMDSAQRNDFDFTILAHTNSPVIEDILGQKVDQRNVFDHGFYMHGEIVGRHFNGPERTKLRMEDIRANKRLAEYDQAIADSQNSKNYVNAERLSIARTTYLKNYTSESAHYKAHAELTEPLTKPFNRDDFAIRLSKELRALELKKGDVIFLHTATQAMMESLSEVKLHLGVLLDVDAYFLFHFGAEAPDARTFIDRYHSYSHFESLALRLKTGSPFKRLNILATSVQLRDELEGFLGVPVGLFDGLTNCERYITLVGGAGHFETARQAVYATASRNEIYLGARVADLDPSRLKAVAEAASLLVELGYKVNFRLAYHSGNRGKAVEFISELDLEIFRLVDTTENETYIRFLIDSTLVVLPYRPDVYKKRVSAVLHDCAVLGITCIVPSGTPLADAGNYCDIFVYDEVEGMRGAIVAAAGCVAQNPLRSESKVLTAKQLFESDVMQRLLNSMAAPSITIEKPNPVAVVMMPLWGRVGSSFAIEAQIRFLLEAGYFVIQILALDKAAKIPDSFSFFWRMLYENSAKLRGNIQRIAFREQDMNPSDCASRKSGFDVYAGNIALNSVEDPIVEALASEADVTVVNHVFNSRLARRLGGKTFILETHDIQSRQMVHWPMLNPTTGSVETYDRLFSAELNEIELYDFVINVSNDEHRQLKNVNKNSTIVTPYIPANFGKPQFESISAMAHNYGWHSSFKNIYKFDFLLIGDSHPANVESGLWFINEIFKPYFQDTKFTLGIVGRVSTSLYENFGALGSVFYCGYVDDIADVRALSNVSILPDRRGSGISIKTLETLAYGSPFVGTSLAFRGLSDLLNTPPETYDEPPKFAERMLALAESKIEREALGEKAWELYLSLAQKSVFDKSWRDIFRRLDLPLRTNLHT